MTLRIRFFSALGGVLIFIALLLFAPAAARAQGPECGSVDALVEVAMKRRLEYRFAEGAALKRLQRILFNRSGEEVPAERAMVAKVRGGFVVAFVTGTVSCAGFMAGSESSEAAEISDFVFGKSI